MWSHSACAGRKGCIPTHAPCSTTCADLAVRWQEGLESNAGFVFHNVIAEKEHFRGPNCKEMA
eukprot:1645914-Rhodomonas_salina.1